MLRLRVVGATLDATPLSMTVLLDILMEKRSFWWKRDRAFCPDILFFAVFRGFFWGIKMVIVGWSWVLGFVSGFGQVSAVSFPTFKWDLG